MANDLTVNEDDDGFRWSPADGRVTKGTILNWNDEKKWHDRDGLSPPSPLLVMGVTTVLRRWMKDEFGNMRPDYITEHPLPDAANLNSTIPKTEWLPGLGNSGPRPPWEFCVVVYLANLVSGELFTFSSTTIGGRMAFDALNEAVVIMRMMRGEKVSPIVLLEERPFQTKLFGLKRRPHFQPVDWRTPKKPPPLAEPTPPPPLPAPASESPPAPPTETAAAAKPEARPAARVTAETMEKMDKVKPVSTEELLNDSIPW
jgi:hypothetical protein